jgi:hypothetical protein
MTEPDLIKEYDEHVARIELERAKKIARAHVIIYGVIGGMAILGAVFLSMCGWV